MRKWGRMALGIVAAGGIALAACGRSGDKTAAGRSRNAFRDVTEAAGISFTYDNDASPAHRFVETTGGGCAFFDFDNDGLLDIFAVQGGPAPGSAAKARPTCVLYRNLGNGRFQDVTRQAGLDVDMGYGQGVAVADYDNDGWQDLLVTSYGALHLFHNDHGHFREVTKEAGLQESGDPHWYTSAAWADYDGDGYLDLAVCRYTSWFVDMDHPCFDGQGRRMYCVPTQYAEDESVLFHNEAGKRFVNVSKKAGFKATSGRALGALWMDLDGDGKPDLFLAHDLAANTFMHNLGGGRFVNVAAQAGVAVGPEGQPLSGMGVAAADFRGKGREDLFVVNFSRQPRSYYLNNGKGVFEWGGPWAGVGESTQPFLAFPAESLDYDRDGHPDLVIGNGHINEILEEPQEGVSYRERQQLLHNLGDGRFEEDRSAAGDLDIPTVTRGLAVGDYDNDGAPDVLLVGPRQPLKLFRNEIHPERHWIGFRLEGTKSNRDGVGAQVWVGDSGKLQLRVVRSGSSYCSHSDIRPLFGLGDVAADVKVEVVWPTGKRRNYGSLRPDGYYLLREDGVVQPDTRNATAAGRGEKINPAASGRGKEKQ